MANHYLNCDGVQVENETILDVPEEMMHNPLGFVVDGGGSLTKVLYRSKKDYCRGKVLKPVHSTGRGVLRLRNFNMDQIDKVGPFLEENCDINIDPDDQTRWWITGITTQKIKKQIEKAFNIKTGLFSEIKAISNFFKNFNKMDFGCEELNLEAVSKAKEQGSLWIDMLSQWANQGETSLSTTSDQKSSISSSFFQPSHEECPGMKLLTSDTAEWVKEHMSFTGKIEAPAIYVNLGSGVPVGLISKSNDTQIVDLMYGMGKLMSALSEELTKEPDFDKFMNMAESGVLENVDLAGSDIQNEDHDEDGWYKSVPSNMSIFEMGKLSSKNVNGKGKYTKEDMAVGLISALSKLISKITFLNARLHNAKSIIFSGSLSKYKIMRFYLEKYLIMESFMNNMNKGELVKIHFLKYPGFLCAMGVWWENVELAKELIHQKNVPN